MATPAVAAEFGLTLVDTCLALGDELPPLSAPYGYVTAAGGLYVRADDGVVRALVPVAPSPRPLPGLAMVEPYAELLAPRVPLAWLLSILRSARAAMPREAMYQLIADSAARNSQGGWACAMPRQSAGAGHVSFLETEGVTVDLHSHNHMDAFFSSTDDADEQGLRFYCVIGRVGTRGPQIAARVGVYGATMRVPALSVFESLGPFIDTLGRCRVCGCSDDQGCAAGCYWVEEDLCSECAGGNYDNSGV